MPNTLSFEVKVCLEDDLPYTKTLDHITEVIEENITNALSDEGIVAEVWVENEPNP